MPKAQQKTKLAVFALMSKSGRGFTLVELLVVISIIGVVMGLSIFGLQGARKSGRDATRKTNLESIRSAVEIYRADCGVYPTALGNSLLGDGSSLGCSQTNVYLAETPVDPLAPDQTYLWSSDGVTYELCARLESDQNAEPVTCGGASSCGNEVCNYKVRNP